MNNSSPFEDLFKNFFVNIRDSFRYHDKYLNLALLLSIIPFPFVGFISLIIAILGLYLNYLKKFEIDETRRLILIILISILNITISLTFAYNAYSVVNSFFYEIIGKVGDFISSVLSIPYI